MGRPFCVYALMRYAVTRMKWLSVVVPVAGIVIAASEPLVRYAVRERQERRAIAIVQRVSEAQRAFHVRTRAYATELTSLTRSCDGTTPLLAGTVLDELAAAGYRMQLRAAGTAAPGPPDCHGSPTAADYYVAAAPLSAATAARQAFAGRSDGRLFLFYDGIPPQEADILSGLATPLAERESFRIP